MLGPGPLRIAAFLFLLLAIFNPTAADHLLDRAEWEVLADFPLEVRFRHEHRTLAEDILGRSRVFLDRVSNFLGIPVGGPYTILIAGSRDEFVELQPEASSVPEWAGALTYPQFGVVILMTPGAMDIDPQDFWSLLEHEMVHLVMGEQENIRQARFPRWLSEGIATYASGEMRLSRLLHLSWAQVTSRTIPFRDLLTDFPKDPGEAEVAYAQSYLFVQYLVRKYGEGAVATLVESVLEQGDMARAVNRSFDVSMGELLDGFDQYARVKATWIPVITSSAVLWGAITLLFLYTYAWKKMVGYRRMRYWDEEESQSNALSNGQLKEGEEPPTVH
ncbi:MAG: hypothetical protein JSV26_01770 [bacterium]|nr:MAG: hypothetical protein JSV26_01770 [bacterium]